MNMELQLLNQKLELIQWLSTIYDSSLIEKIMDLRKTENIDWWNLTSEIERESIELGLKDSESGKLNDHFEARKIYEKWL